LLIQDRKQIGRVERPAWQNRSGVNPLALFNNFKLLTSKEHRDGSVAEINHPNQFDSGLKVLAPLTGHLAVGVPLTQDLNYKVWNQAR